MQRARHDPDAGTRGPVGRSAKGAIGVDAALAPLGEAQPAPGAETGGFIEPNRAALMTTITPTRRPGLRAGFDRFLFGCTHALRRIPAWQGVSLVMACATAAMVVLSPGSLVA
jgi:hypothetical protein